MIGSSPRIKKNLAAGSIWVPSLLFSFSHHLLEKIAPLPKPFTHFGCYPYSIQLGPKKQICDMKIRRQTGWVLCCKWGLNPAVVLALHPACNLQIAHKERVSEILSEFSNLEKYPAPVNKIFKIQPEKLPCTEFVILHGLHTHHPLHGETVRNGCLFSLESWESSLSSLIQMMIPE